MTWAEEHQSTEAAIYSTWWEESKEDVHKAVSGLVEHLLKVQDHHRTRDIANLNLYGDTSIASVEPWRYTISSVGSESSSTYNVARSAIDTLHSHMVGNRVKPMFLTDGGTRKDQNQAKGMQQFIHGQFYEQKTYTMAGKQAVRDALVLGTGGLLVTRDGNKPCVERAVKCEFVIDDAEAHYGTPRSLYRKRYINREVLLSVYPDSETEISDAKDETDGNDGATSVVDMVAVYEAWHLPSAEGKKDGRHVICIGTGAMRDVPWKYDTFPIAWARYKKPMFGYWGTSVCEILEGKQITINENLWFRDECIRNAMPMIFVEPGSNLNTAHMNNRPWNMYESVRPPHLVVPQSVPADLFTVIREDIQDAFSMVGVNMLSARSEIPAGLDGGSGKAIRMYADQKSENFIDFEQEHEEMYMEAARLLIQVNSDIAKDGHVLEVVAETSSGKASKLKWPDVDLQNRPNIMKVSPVSFLTGTPQDKIADIEAIAGIRPEMADHMLEALEFPDLKAITTKMNAAKEANAAIIDRMLDTGELISPVPFMDLAGALSMAQSRYLQSMTEGEDEDRLEVLRLFMELVQDMLNPPPEPVAAPAPPMALPPGPVGPEGMPPPALVPPPQDMQMPPGLPPGPGPAI